jgi:hypothetical protein
MTDDNEDRIHAIFTNSPPLGVEDINPEHPDHDRIIASLQRDQCPDCNEHGFVDGPRGGAGINIFCAHCGSGFNVALPRAVFMVQRIPGRKQ